MIHIHGLEFFYPDGEFHLSIPELELKREESVAVIGPSGTGKTTFLNLIAGIAHPNSGRVTTKGVDLASLGAPAVRAFRIQHLGLIFQEFELLEYLTVWDNILLPYRIHSALLLIPEVRERARRLATEVGIEPDLPRFVDQLSQGERQRVAICRALLPQPELLLADEPTGNLDPRNKGRVLDILFAYVRREGATLVTVTHDHELLGRFQRVIDFGEFHPKVEEESLKTPESEATVSVATEDRP